MGGRKMFAADAVFVVAFVVGVVVVVVVMRKNHRHKANMRWQSFIQLFGVFYGAANVTFRS